MTVKEILTPIIEQEFRKYENNGYKIKLKTIAKRRKVYTICCAIIIFLYIFLFKELSFLIMPFTIPLYIFIVLKLLKTKKSIIISLILYICFLPTINDFLSSVMCIPLTLIIYVILMIKTNKYDTIISLARKKPDTPVEQIIAQEIQLQGNSMIKSIASALSIGLIIFSCTAGIGFLYDSYGDLISDTCTQFIYDTGQSIVDNIYNITDTSNSSEASSVQRNENNTYEEYNGGYKLVSWGSQDMNSQSITIPDKYEGLDIVAIGDCAFSGFNNLETIVIPNTIQEINERAFENCSKLNNVVIPDSVTIINSRAFMNCTSLTDITFGCGITAIEGECFKGCTSLVDFIVPATVTELRGNCFEDCHHLKSVSLHNQITAIHAYAFKNCTSLEYITLPENITEIRANTFENCISLKEISIPEGVTRIAAHSFRGCYSLNKVEVPDSVLEIGSSAFRNCKSLMSIELPKGTFVDKRSFKDSPTKITYK